MSVIDQLRGRVELARRKGYCNLPCVISIEDAAALVDMADWAQRVWRDAGDGDRAVEVLKRIGVDPFNTERQPQG